jgi:hypothetical protein
MQWALRRLRKGRGSYQCQCDPRNGEQNTSKKLHVGNARCTHTARLVHVGAGEAHHRHIYSSVTRV